MGEEDLRGHRLLAAAAAAVVDGGVVLEAEEAVDGGGVGGMTAGETVDAHPADRGI